MLLVGPGVADPPNTNEGAGVELDPNGSVEIPGVWPAKRLDPLVGAGVVDPAPKLNDGMLSEAFGVTPKVTDGLISAGLVVTGAAAPNVKAGAEGAATGVCSGAGATGAPNVNAGATGAVAGTAGPPKENPPEVEGLASALSSSAWGSLRRRPSSSCETEMGNVKDGLSLLPSSVRNINGFDSVADPKLNSPDAAAGAGAGVDADATPVKLNIAPPTFGWTSPFERPGPGSLDEGNLLGGSVSVVDFKSFCFTSKENPTAAAGGGAPKENPTLFALEEMLSDGVGVIAPNENGTAAASVGAGTLAVVSAS